MMHILVVLIEEAFIKERAVWLDERDVDADTSQFEAQGFRQTFHGMFRAGINRKAGLRIVMATSQAANVDDAPYKMSNCN